MEVSNIFPLSSNVIKQDKLQINNDYNTLNKISESLIYLRKAFKGDMDCLLIYLIILLDNLSINYAGEIKRKAGVSGLSISEITGIARETVRRKIVFLINSGMIYREHNGYCYVKNNEAISFIGLKSVEIATQIIFPARKN